MSIATSLRRPFRQFRRQPLYAFSVAGTLALAVAAGTASFAVVKRAFIDPLPYRQAQELVSLLTVIDGDTWAVAAPVLEDIRASGAPIADYAPIDPEGVTFSDGQSTEQITGAYISPAFFSTLGIHPAVGQPWREGDQRVAIVSWAFWQQKLGGSPDSVGRTILVNGLEHVVAGVMPEGFIAPYFNTVSVWLPLDMQPLMAGSGRARRSLSVIARLAPGFTVEQLNVHLDLLSAQLQKQHPQIHGRQAWTAKPLREEMIGAARPVLLGTGAAAVLLLILVFANVAGLSAARSIAMRRQFAVCVALGASRMRILGERLSDSLAITLAGSAAGVWLGGIVVTVVAANQRQFMPRLAAVELDATTAAFGFAVGVITGLAASILPESAANAAASLDALRGARGSSGGAADTRLRSALVVTQVALALVLLVGAGLLVRTVHHLTTSSLGFNPEGLTTLSVTMPVPKYATEERQLQFERDVLDRLARIPGVSSTAASVGFPVIGSTRASLSIIGRSDEAGRGEIAYMSMSPGFVRFSGMRLVAGRDLQQSDHVSAPLVVLINETMARQYWPQGDAIGAKTRIGPGTGGPVIEIVGIVADVRFHGPTQPVMPTSFGSTLQYSWPRRHFSVRSDAAPAVRAAELRAAIRAADPDVALGLIQTVDDMVTNQTGRHRLVMFGLVFFGAIATALCALGLYAVVALTSHMRRREYAIRLALGAPRADVRWMVVRQALVLALAGTVLGLFVAATGTRLLSGLLHGVTPLDVATFAFASLAVLALAVLSASLPARSAGRVDPVEALRAE